MATSVRNSTLSAMLLALIGLSAYLGTLLFFDVFANIKRGEHGQMAIQMLDQMRRPFLTLKRLEHGSLHATAPAAAHENIERVIREGHELLARYTQLTGYNEKALVQVNRLGDAFADWTSITRKLIRKDDEGPTQRADLAFHNGLTRLASASTREFLNTMNTLGDGEILIHQDITAGRRAVHLLQITSLIFFAYLVAVLFWQQWRSNRHQRAALAEELRLSRLAHFDNLTRLPNRLLLADRLSYAMAEARRSQKRLAVLYVDLDNFKPVNDEFGHHAGDELLRQAAQRMQACLRDTDTVARIGGDEFAIVLTNITDPSSITKVTKNIVAALARPVDLDVTTVCIHASIGIAIYPDHGNSHDTLIQVADEAMLEVKKQGKSAYQFAGVLPTVAGDAAR